MANRFPNPFEQMFEATTKDFLSGGRLFAYVTGTSTKTDTYTTETLAVANANPVVLDSAGRHGPIFLDPAVTYKFVLAAAGSDDPPTSAIATADPVVDPAANVAASFRVYPGNPNGFVAGSAGTVGGSGASVVWDITNQLLYVCTTSGTASTAVWTQIGGSLAGQVTQTGMITPTALAASTNDWNPTGLETSSVIRASASGADRNVTGIDAQPEGTLLTIHNIGTTHALIFKREDSASAAANRIASHADIQIEPNMSVTFRYDGTSSRWRPTSKAEDNFPPGYLYALTLTNDAGDLTNDIAVAAGKCRSGDDVENMVLAASITKRLDAAWVVGTNQGGLDTGAIANTTYHVFLIKRTDTGVVDVLFSASLTPTMPTNYDYSRRIGSIIRAGATILAFSQVGDTFLLATTLVTVDAVDPGAVAVTRALNVPADIIVDALITVGVHQVGATSVGAYVSSLNQVDQAVQAPGTAALTGFVTVTGGAPATSAWNFAPLTVRTNASSQVRTRCSATGTSDRLGIITRGWLDTRGRLV